MGRFTHKYISGRNPIAAHTACKGQWWKLGENTIYKEFSNYYDREREIERLPNPTTTRDIITPTITTIENLLSHESRVNYIFVKPTDLQASIIYKAKACIHSIKFSGYYFRILSCLVLQSYSCSVDLCFECLDLILLRLWKGKPDHH